MASKLGFHLGTRHDDAVAAVLDAAQAVAVKGIDPLGDPAWWSARKRANRQCVYLYRHYWPRDRQETLLLAGADGGRAAAREVLQTVEPYRDVFSLVEGLNEPTGDWPESDRWRYNKLDEFQEGFYGAITAEGLIPVAFNVGTGNLDHEIVRRYFPRTLERYLWYGAHEYDWPRLDDPHWVGWLALRYRNWLSSLPEQARVVITECGLTQATHSGPDTGWRSGVSAQEYLRNIFWYDSQLQQDQQVVGACVYMLGCADDWATFELLGDVADGMVEHIRGQSGANDPGQSTGGEAMGDPFGAWRCTQPFGITEYSRAHPEIYPSGIHAGRDYALSVGTPVRAPASGFIWPNEVGPAYGITCMMEDAQHYVHLFAHLSRRAVDAGQFVEPGDIVGYSGNTGLSSGPHLHWGVRKSGAWIDPAIWWQSYREADMKREDVERWWYSGMAGCLVDGKSPAPYVPEFGIPTAIRGRLEQGIVTSPPTSGESDWPPDPETYTVQAFGPDVAFYNKKTGVVIWKKVGEVV
jgi:hypothetical protein